MRLLLLGVLLWVGGCLFGVTWGYIGGERAGRLRAANDLIAAGFTVIDPEGFPVDHFEE